MKIQKGIVKYKDRDDIVCTYGVTDNGESYYFLDEGHRLSNGNIIATTELVEAVDPMFKAKKIGVIDNLGNVVIPFAHRSIRSVNNDILLAEIAQPVTPSVIEANQMKSDPTLATKLVSTPALIKEKLNSKMSSEGRYIFNDQFSEATIYDINGNNLVNGEYFSFIAIDNGKIFFSKNVADSEIVEYSVLPPEVQSNVAFAENNINVNNVAVSSDVVEKALTNDVNESVVSTPRIPEVPVENTVVNEVAPEIPEVPVEDAAVNAVAPEIPEVPVEDAVVNEVAPEIPEVPVEDAFANAVAPEIPEVPVEDTFANAVAPEIPEVPVEDAFANAVAPEIPEVPVEDAFVNEAAPEIPEVPVEDTVVNEATPEVPEVPVEDAFANAVAPEIPEVPVEDTVVNEATPEVPEVPVEDTTVNAVAPEIPAQDNQSNEDNIMDVIESIISNKDFNKNNDNTSVIDDNDYTINDKVPLEDEEVEEIPFSNVVMDEDVPEDVDHVIDIPEESVEENEIDIADDDENDYDFDESVEDTPIDDMFHANQKYDYDKDDNLSSISTDDIEEVDYDSSYNKVQYVGSNNSIMSDVAKSMTKLMRQNRELKSELSSVKEKLDKVTTSRRNIADKSNMQEKKIDALNTKIRNLESSISKLEMRNESLENKNREQEKVINSQAHELNSLRPQLQGKEDLMKVLADAQALLGEGDSYSYQDDDYYKKVA